MILSDEEVEDRIASPENLVNVIRSSTGGRNVGSINIPPAVRELVGRLANITNETQQEVADAFELDDAVVSKASRGLVHNRYDKDLKSSVSPIQAKSDGIHEQALDVLMDTLTALQPRLTEVNKAKDLSKIATDMARVASLMKDKNASGITNNTQVILYAPPKKDISKYEVIEA